MFASDYRRIARHSLEGNWGPSIVAALIASILGGLISGSGSVNLEFDTDLLQSVELNFPML